MILTVDIGNTSITCGLFEAATLVKKFRIPSDTKWTVKEYCEALVAEIDPYKIEGGIIGSVVDELNSRISYALTSMFGICPVMLSCDSILPIKLALLNNTEVGADRIANGVRAYNLYKKSVIVVDFGTATTFDVVNSGGEFVGGLIAPGIGTQLKSLNLSTSKLPDLDITSVHNAIGNSTNSAILSGVIKGTACMVEGMIKNTEEELEEQAIIIATGGYCSIISEHMTRKFDKIAPDLTLEGLLDLYNLNKTDTPVFSKTDKLISDDIYVE